MKENERTKVESKRRNMKREEAKRTYSLDSAHGESKTKFISDGHPHV